MSDASFWDTLKGQLEDGASRLLDREITNFVGDKKQQAPTVVDNTGAIASLNQKIQENMTIVLVVGVILAIAIFFTGRRRRGK